MINPDVIPLAAGIPLGILSCSAAIILAIADHRARMRAIAASLAKTDGGL